MKMIFRTMEMKDVIGVSKLFNELAYYIKAETKDEYFNFDTLNEDSVSDHLREFIEHPDRTVLIAEDGNRIVGFIAGEIVSCFLAISRINQVGYISGAYVISEYRGRGIMKALENQINVYFKNKNIAFVELNFISKNEIAKQTWKALGYETFREQARKKL